MGRGVVGEDDVVFWVVKWGVHKPLWLQPPAV